MIKINKLNKYFFKGKQNQIHVINNIDLELPESGMVAVFGKSGCGKTTLLNVIGGLDSFESGYLEIDGQNIKKDTDVLRNKYIGYIFQNYNLHKSETCFDNVADALRLCGMTDEEEISKRVMATLANVGLEKYGSRTPDTLSGGQQQRVAIARAIVKNPRIILADEPTGNLDEANTVMIMDLLKRISRDRLVLLVTHEAKLVDFYCDRIIELSDGRVISTRENMGAEGYTARGKNDIYLGELAHDTLRDANAQIEYYGDAPDTPVKLRIVNDGGKLYIRIDTPKVQILDEYSEVKLREGVYEQKARATEMSEKIDMSALPEIQGSKFGRLFGFKSSCKSGYAANFKKLKKGKKVLRACLCLFAVVVVIMSSVFGTAIADIQTVNDSYNHNVFYLYTPDSDVSDKLMATLGSPESAIDAVRLNWGMPEGDTTIRFAPTAFETFGNNNGMNNYESFLANAVLLDAKLSDDMTLVSGKRDGLAQNEVLITTAVADTLLDKSAVGYIDEYDDLLGLSSSQIRINGETIRIAGVVESEETAIYLSTLSLARMVLDHTPDLSVKPASDYFGVDVAEGETVILFDVVDGSKKLAEQLLPKAGDKIKIHGVSLTVKEVQLVQTQTDKYGNYVNSVGKNFLLNGLDYINISQRMGETYKYANLNEVPIYDYSAGGEYYTGGGEIVPTGVDVAEIEEVYIYYDMSYSAKNMYTVIHSTDPERTAEYLEREFSDLETPDAYMKPIITPMSIHDDTMAQHTTEILSNLISMGVMLVLMSVCMYFIMRSSLMNRIKEVGIYRAIGVSKKNLVFRFFVEALVLTTLTVFLGYLGASVFMRMFLGLSTFVEAIVYYPLWYAGAVLAVIYAVCLFFGTLPTINLLRKTPSQILAKYDI